MSAKRVVASLGAGVEITETKGGCLLAIKVRPNARANGIDGVHGNALRVSVCAAPENGAANAAVVALLAGALGVPKSSVEIVRGAASRDKTVAISGLTTEELRARL